MGYYKLFFFTTSLLKTIIDPAYKPLRSLRMLRDTSYGSLVAFT